MIRHPTFFVPDESVAAQKNKNLKKKLFYLPLCVPLSTCAINSQVRFWRPTILCSTSSCPSPPSVLRWWHTVVVQCYRLSRSARHSHRWDFYIRLNYSMIFYESLFNGSFQRLGFVASSGRMVLNSWLKTRRREVAVACPFLHTPQWNWGSAR